MEHKGPFQTNVMLPCENFCQERTGRGRRTSWNVAKAATQNRVGWIENETALGTF